MINQLTKEQEDQLDIYTRMWTDFGLDTKTDFYVSAEINLAYTQSGLQPPKEILYAQSPADAIRMAKERGATDFTFFSGQHAAHILGFYDYFNNVLNLKDETAPMQPFIELGKKVGWCLFYEEVAIVSAKPIEIYLNAAGQLHRDNGPAMLFSDGLAFYSLNGVPFNLDLVVDDPKETKANKKRNEYLISCVLRPASEISVKEIFKEENVDVRRELLRKVGLERLITETKAKTIDRYSIEGRSPRPVEYLLLEINLGDGLTARVLKMDNPSINAVHVEGVPDEISTVKEALLWRAGFDTDKSYTDPARLA